MISYDLVFSVYFVSLPVAHGRNVLQKYVFFMNLSQKKSSAAAFSASVLRGMEALCANASFHSAPLFLEEVLVDVGMSCLQVHVELGARLGLLAKHLGSALEGAVPVHAVLD